MLRWIVEDTRALIADLRAFWRRLSTRWQWMRLRSRRRVDQAAAELENVRRSAGTRTRMCTSCRALIPFDARACPECGEAPGRPVTRGVSRVIENMLPGFVSVTSTILTLNVLLYGLTQVVSSQLAAGGLPPPLQGGAWEYALIVLGANSPQLTTHGEYWRLLSYVFLHGGILHLVMNSWALLTVGPMLEEIYGSSRYVLVYIVTGICGGLFSAVWRRDSWGPGIGASGAIFGLIGLAAVWGWRRGGSLGEGIRAQMVQWALYGLVMGYMFRFDNAAHLGGLLSGALMGMLLGDAQSARRSGDRLWELIAVGCMLLVVGSFVMVGLKYQETLQLIVR